MTDIFDRAQELEALQRDQALATFAAGQPSGHSYSHCEDCGEEIPAARRRLVRGCTRCVTCQELTER